MKSNHPTKKAFVLIWLALVVMHFMILGSAYLNLGFINTPLILVLAVVQMLLILAYFMEVRYSAKLIWVAAAAGFFWLLIQWTLTFSDYLMRQWH
ncbi:MAG TPA: cytochrome C oxidase subunit IV family protein [Candidatus Baltobacteraceae bacterium]|nr:cytochrome C oxidase subunit IV family protein [Candidatus Baltobacteraceae bacterium]